MKNTIREYLYMLLLSILGPYIFLPLYVLDKEKDEDD